MNKDLPIWLIKPQTFSHFMYALGFIQLYSSKSFYPALRSIILYICVMVSARHASLQHWHYIFLHHSLLPRIPSHITSTHLSLPNADLHLLNSARLPGSVFFESTLLEIASRQKARVIINVHFVFPCWSQILCRLLSNVWNHCFKFYPTTSLITLSS